MKKILVLLGGFVALACAMDVPQNLNPIPATGPENIYANLKFNNKTNHNLVIVNNATNEVVTGLKPQEIKDKNVHVSFEGKLTEEKERNQGQFWTGYSREGQTYYRIDAIKNGKSSTLGFLRITADAPSWETNKFFISVSLPAKTQSGRFVTKGSSRNTLEISSSQGLTGNERIDIDAQIVLEGEDLSQSKIEDLTARY